MKPRILLIAPIESSAFACCLLVRLAEMSGIEVAGVLLRKITLARVVSEWKRDGLRLLRKFWTKHILRGRRLTPLGIRRTARQQLDQRGLGRFDLGDLCRKMDVPLLRVESLNESKAVNFVRQLGPSLAVFSGGGMIRKDLIEVCGSGILNCHMGPLPRYRGMDVVEWPILEGRERAHLAITVHLMDLGLDTGPIVEVTEIPREGCSTIADLRLAAEEVKIDALLRAVLAHSECKLRASPQTLEDGRQYYVLHPELERRARRLATRLYSHHGEN